MKKKRQEPKPVGEGTYRRVFDVGPKLVGKEVKSTKGKKIFLFNVKFPMRLYNALKLVFGDINKDAYRKYLALSKLLPENLAENFGRIRGLRKQGRKSILLMDKVRDFDRSTSKNLSQTGPIESEYFWRKMDEIERFLIEKNIPFFSITQGNIMVRWLNQRDCEPVFIDIKRMGLKYYPDQPWLAAKTFSTKKKRKAFSRIRERYKKWPKKNHFDKRLKNC